MKNKEITRDIRHDLCRKCFRSGNDSRRYESKKALEENFREEAERIEWERFLWAAP
jgi:hypothetical protein